MTFRNISRLFVHGMSAATIRVHAAGRSAVLSGTELVIGRSPYCTLVLDHPTVSRVHASLRRVNGRIELSDLGSRNGTYTNGQRLAEGPRILEVGDEVFIGEVKLILESVEARHFADSGTCEVLPYQADGDPVTEIGVVPPLTKTGDFDDRD